MGLLNWWRNRKKRTNQEIAMEATKDVAGRPIKPGIRPARDMVWPVQRERLDNLRLPRPSLSCRTGCYKSTAQDVDQEEDDSMPGYESRD